MNFRDFNLYQAQAIRTKPEGTHKENVSNFSMGLAGECGEVVDMLKKVLYHGHTLDRAKLVKELGDVQWYVALICDEFKINMDELPIENICKLRRRYPNGFNEDDSKNRTG